MVTLSNFLQNDFGPFDIDCGLEEVQDFFSSIDYSHFPVMQEGVFMGCISSNDAETFEKTKKISNYRYTLEGFFVRDTTIWLDVLETLAQNEANIVPVLNEKNEYLGFYEKKDVLDLFSETPFLKEQGGIIVIQKPTIDFSMSQITQIIESNNGKILGIFVSATDAGFVQSTIKLTSGSLNEIIQSFRRYNYEIISEHQEDTYLNNLKERSDYLDKYLNI